MTLTWHTSKPIHGVKNVLSWIVFFSLDKTVTADSGQEEEVEEESKICSLSTKGNY